MAARPGNGPPNNPRNPFNSPPQQYYQQPVRDYDTESDAASMYGRRGDASQYSSTTQLNARDPFSEYLPSHSGLWNLIGYPRFSPYHLVRGDNESEVDAYGNHYASSIDSHTGPSYPSGLSNYSDMPGPRGSKDPYPAWTADRQIPMSTE